MVGAVCVIWGVLILYGSVKQETPVAATAGIIAHFGGITLLLFGLRLCGAWHE